MSVLSMLAEPNVESGANIEVSWGVFGQERERGGRKRKKTKNKEIQEGSERLIYIWLRQCCKLIRDNPKEYERIVRRQVRQQLGIPGDA
jgi:ubiquitin-protein ligase